MHYADFAHYCATRGVWRPFNWSDGDKFKINGCEYGVLKFQLSKHDISSKQLIFPLSITSSNVCGPWLRRVPILRRKSAPSDWWHLDRFTFVMVFNLPPNFVASLIQVSEPPHNSGSVIGGRASYPSSPDLKDKELCGKGCLEIRKTRQNELDRKLQDLAMRGLVF